ncbi:gp53-like domain-containing protein [Atlantibacter subterraneus]|uniref:gp53-like domain-containing protein n=1 Tax=Atlantibacter subterraneus TaxID=255519 RepID=UPI0028A074C4|nr:phage tail protein [Atlantibacter subterranea]
MPTNDFKPFATAGGANVSTQAEYLALAALSTGWQSGKASSKEINKAVRQATFIAAAVAQFIADQGNVDVLDDGNLAGIVTKLIAAMNKTSQPLDTTLTALATLVGEADKLPYFNGTDAAALADLTQVGRDIIGKNNAAEVLAYLGLGELVLAGTITGVFDTNGYLKIPAIIGGVKKTLIIQWGNHGNTASATTETHYPIPFPTKVFQVVACGFQVAGNQQAYVTVNSANPLNRFAWNGFYANGGQVPILSTVANQVGCQYIVIGW